MFKELVKTREYNLVLFNLQLVPLFIKTQLLRGKAFAKSISKRVLSVLLI